MDYFDNPRHLRLLQDLLKEPEENSDSEPDDRVPSCSTQFVTPTALTAEDQVSNADCSSNSASSSYLKSSEQPRKLESTPQTLSEWEQQEAALNDEAFEERSTPEYRIVYKQSVTPEDIYLQMGNKTPATASCEEMCLEILMPRETVSIDRMQLDVTPDEIDLRTPVYRLKLPLIQQIDPDRGKASWDESKKILRVTVRMKREYDFINF